MWPLFCNIHRTKHLLRQLRSQPNMKIIDDHLVQLLLVHSQHSTKHVPLKHRPPPASQCASAAVKCNTEAPKFQIEQVLQSVKDSLTKCSTRQERLKSALSLRLK